MKPVILSLLLTLSVTSIGHADWNEPPVEGAKEHPLLKFYPEAHVSEYDYKDFDSAEIVTGYTKTVDGESAKIETFEGKVTKYGYEHKPNTSILEIIHQYEGALKKTGFTTVLIGKVSAYSELPFSTDDTFGSFRLDKNGKPAVWINIRGTYNGGAEYPESYVTIVELKGMDQKMEAADANALFDELQKAGHVAVYGINFDTGKSVIKPESDKVLGEVSKLLAAHPDLKLKIEGHTDNVGTPASNQKLSMDRANAVKTWLTGKGAKTENLTTAGFGDTKPVADNGTDEGKAKNRRVELVKQ